jgi:hypothetical protein
MATYIDNTDGAEVDAHQLDTEVKYPSGNVGEKGDWVVEAVEDSLPLLYAPDAFSARFTQKYPKPVDGVRVDPPKPIPAPPGVI